ncbi:MAG: hypothetical protein ACFFD1_00030 [Candidatus Thorarchaeota archaeon]
MTRKLIGASIDIINTYSQLDTILEALNHRSDDVSFKTNIVASEKGLEIIKSELEMRGYQSTIKAKWDDHYAITITEY